MNYKLELINICKKNLQHEKIDQQEVPRIWVTFLKSLNPKNCFINQNHLVFRTRGKKFPTLRDGFQEINENKMKLV